MARRCRRRRAGQRRQGADRDHAAEVDGRDAQVDRPTHSACQLPDAVGQVEITRLNVDMLTVRAVRVAVAVYDVLVGIPAVSVPNRT